MQVLSNRVDLLGVQKKGNDAEEPKPNNEIGYVLFSAMLYSSQKNL